MMFSFGSFFSHFLSFDGDFFGICLQEKWFFMGNRFSKVFDFFFWKESKGISEEYLILYNWKISARLSTLKNVLLWLLLEMVETEAQAQSESPSIWWCASSECVLDPFTEVAMLGLVVVTDPALLLPLRLRSDNDNSNLDFPDNNEHVVIGIGAMTRM